MTPPEQKTALPVQEDTLWLICAMLVQFQLRLLLYGGSLPQAGIDLFPPAVLLFYLLLRRKQLHHHQFFAYFKEE